MPVKFQLLHMGPGLTVSLDPANPQNDRIVQTDILTAASADVLNLWAIANAQAGTGHYTPPLGTVRVIGMDNNRALRVSTYTALVPGRYREVERIATGTRFVNGVPRTVLHLEWIVPQKVSISQALGAWSGKIASAPPNGLVDTLNDAPFHLVQDWPANILKFNGITGHLDSIGIVYGAQGNVPMTQYENGGAAFMGFSFTADTFGWDDRLDFLPASFPQLPV